MEPAPRRGCPQVSTANARREHLPIGVLVDEPDDPGSPLAATYPPADPKPPQSVLEPISAVDVTVPTEAQGDVIGEIDPAKLAAGASMSAEEMRTLTRQTSANASKSGRRYDRSSPGSFASKVSSSWSMPEPVAKAVPSTAISVSRRGRRPSVPAFAATDLGTRKPLGARGSGS